MKESFAMKKSLAFLFILLGFLLGLLCPGVSAGASPLPYHEIFMIERWNEALGRNANTQTKQSTKSPTQEKTITDQEKKTPDKAPDQDKKTAINLQDYVGRYEADPNMVENFIFDVFVEKDELWIKPSHSPKSRLEAKSTDVFVITAVNGPIRFTRDAKGVVQSLTLEGAAAAHAQPLTAKKLVLPSPSLKGSTTFRLKGYPNARVVAVAGSFNDFSQSKVICGREETEWVCRLDLPPGKYTYKFIIDGDWILDPENASVEADERGFENSVLVVK